MNKLLNLAALAALCLFISCNDDDLPPVDVLPTFDSVLDWNPLTLGSYWIYEKFSADELGNFVSQEQLDTIFLNEAVFLEGNEYRKFDGNLYNLFGRDLQRDSAEFIVNFRGQKMFSTAQTPEVLDQSVFVSHRLTKIMQGDTLVNFAIGEHLAKYAEGFFDELNPDLIPEDCEQTLLDYWVKEIGLVRMEYFFSSGCERVRHELIDYHIEP